MNTVLVLGKRETTENTVAAVQNITLKQFHETKTQKK